jgi:hypothetical protein
MRSLRMKTAALMLSTVVMTAAGMAAAQGIDPQFPGVAPPVPSPRSQSLPPTYRPPPPTVAPAPRTESFGDRVTRCNHAYPLGAGQGNNPTDRDAFVRSCAN